MLLRRGVLRCQVRTGRRKGAPSAPRTAALGSQTLAAPGAQGSREGRAPSSPTLTFRERPTRELGSRVGKRGGDGRGSKRPYPRQSPVKAGWPTVT